MASTLISGIDIAYNLCFVASEKMVVEYLIVSDGGSC